MSNGGSRSGPVGYSPIAQEVEFDETGMPVPTEHWVRKKKEPKEDSSENASSDTRRGGYDMPGGLLEQEYKRDSGWPQAGKPTMTLPQPKEEKMDKVTGKKNVFFRDIVRITKLVFPELKMRFPQPPTYIWNPKEEGATLDIKEVKNKLKTKFPKLIWTSRFDGVEVAEIVFDDGSTAEFSIGLDANHLTLIHNIPKKEQPVEEAASFKDKVVSKYKLVD